MSVVSSASEAATAWHDNGCLIIVGRSRGRSHRFDLVHILGVSVVDLLAHLFGPGELDSLAGGSSQLCDALLLSEVLAGDPDQVDGLLYALLNGLGKTTSTPWMSSVTTGML